MTHTQIKRTEKRLENTFRTPGILSRLGVKFDRSRRMTNGPRTIRHWTPTDGFVAMTLGG